MNLAKFIDLNGDIIELTEERWEHILSEHPEVSSLRDRIGGILKEADLVKRSRHDKAVRLYYRFDPEVWGGKYLLLVAKKAERSFVLTFYITDEIKQGDTIWERK